ncbi:hypothetical protein C5167_036529 [Papaver somniferum]|uniref:Uncharacterized protein n=1 Tax=Papaver somniferum TaxID=3469 RepID=A0A4Y7I681_PAPSO|nr:hypothetical protein C5167_036529 [Papaver somniferum]
MGNSKVFMGILINFRKRYAQAFHGKLESTYGNPDKFPQGFDIPDTSLPRSLENKTYFSCLLQQVLVLLRLPNETSVLTESRARKVTSRMMDMQLIKFFTLQHPMEFWVCKKLIPGKADGYAAD